MRQKPLSWGSDKQAGKRKSCLRSVTRLLLEVCKLWQIPVSVLSSMVTSQKKVFLSGAQPFACAFLACRAENRFLYYTIYNFTIYNFPVHISRVTFLLPTLVFLKCVRDFVSPEEQIHSTDHLWKALYWTWAEQFSYSYESFSFLIQLICTHRSHHYA